MPFEEDFKIIETSSKTTPNIQKNIDQMGKNED